MLPLAKPQTPQTAPSWNESDDQDTSSNRRHPLDPPQCLVHAEHEILIFLYFEPATVFKIGYPSDYGFGIDEKWLQKYRIWVDRTPDRLFVIYARCTHLGCAPDWKPAEGKFKCPCHGRL